MFRPSASQFASGRRVLAAAAAAAGATALALAVTVAPAFAASAVTINNFAFAPLSLTVPAGTTVTWTNQDSVGHSVTSDTGAFDSSPSNCSPTQSGGCIQPSGGTFPFTFSSPGTYAYHCRVHNFMHGTIVVTAVTTTTAAPVTTVPSTAPPTTIPGTPPTTAAPGTGTGSGSGSGTPTVAGATVTTVAPALAMTGATDLARLSEIAAGLVAAGALAAAGAGRKRRRARS